MLGPEFDSIVGAAQAGAGWAWRRLYDDLAGQVLGYMRAQGAQEPEELFGEVLLQMARNLGGFRGDESGFRSWVFQIAHNRVIDERRRRRRNPIDPVESIADLVPPQGDLTAGHALDAVLADHVRDLIERLVPGQRDVLLLRIVSGLTVPEVAAVVGKSEGAVKALQRRGLAALSRYVNTEGIPR